MALADKENQEAGGTIEEVFVSNEAALLGYARKLVRSREVAEDLVQEAFIRLNKIFSAVRQPRPWLYRTIHNLAMNYQRDNHKWTALASDNGEGADQVAVDAEPLPDERMVKLETIGQALICLEELDERKRALVKMKFEDGLSYKEIAARTGMTTGHVGYSLHHALKEMALTLKKKGLLS